MRDHPRRRAKVITARLADALLDAVLLAGPVQVARHQLAAEYVADLRHLDAKLAETKKTITAAVRASGTSLTSVFGVGPVTAATILGDVPDISRFPDRDHFAACNGTAPVEASSGKRKVFRLSRRGNRRINHAIHMAAVTQVSHWHSPGRSYYDKKRAQGKTGKEALRALKRRISDAIYAQLRADARLAARLTGPGGHPGNGSNSGAAGSHPHCQLFGQATPGPAASLRPAPRAAGAKQSRTAT